MGVPGGREAALVAGRNGCVPPQPLAQLLAGAVLRPAAGGRPVHRAIGLPVAVECQVQSPVLVEADHIGRIHDITTGVVPAITSCQDPAVGLQGQGALDPFAGLLAQRQFAEERRRFFVGRETIRAKITDYLRQPERRTLVILGEGGTGKSALMAKALAEAEQNFHGRAIVYRFIGATAGSSDGRSLLDSLCREISRCYGADQSTIPLDYRDLVFEFGKRLALATAEKPLILFLDSHQNHAGMTEENLTTSKAGNGLWEQRSHLKLTIQRPKATRIIQAPQMLFLILKIQTKHGLKL